MKFGKKYLFPPCLTLFWFALGGVMVLLVEIFVSLSYDYLCEILPSVFTSPGPTSDPEGYERMRKALSLTVLALTVLPATYLSMRLDNSRFEHVVVLSEGLYKIPEQTKKHIRSFWLSDLISAALAPALLTFPVFLIPEDYLRFFLPVFWCGARLYGFFGPVSSLAIIISMSAVARLILTPSVLRAWRASWLTGSID